MSELLPQCADCQRKFASNERKFWPEIKTGVQILSNLGARAALPQNCSKTRYVVANDLKMARGC
jgi:hypothetical protein